MRRGFLFFAAALGGFFILFCFYAAPATADDACATSSAWSSLKINEFSSYDSNDWVEIYNNDSACVDLTGLWLWDSLLTSPMKKFSGMSVAANAWQLVDVGTRLNRGGDSVVLATSSIEYDRVDYGEGNVLPAPTSSQTLARSIDGAGEWRLTDSSTPGAANIIFLAPTTTPEIPTTTPTSTPEEPETPTSTPETPTSTPAVDTSTVWAGIKINEIVSDPSSGNEWVEFFNPATSSLDLANGWLCDSRGATSTYACKSPTGTIPANGFLIFETGTAYLNNDADSVILKNPSGEIVDQIDYADDLAPEKGESLARKIDGLDTGALSDWALTTQITPAAANVIVAPILPASGGGGSTSPPPSPYQGEGEEAATSSEAVILATSSPFISSSTVFINEIYPNPPGSDSFDEFIEIKNNSSSSVDLAGWKIGDSARGYTLASSLGPGQIIFLKRALTKIALNNTGGEEVKLIDSAGRLVDLIFYERAGDGESFGRDESGDWRWSAEPTPGKENIFPALEAEENSDDEDEEGEGEIKISTSDKKISPVYSALTLVEARAADVGEKVVARGFVSALPNIFGSQYFYIGEKGVGIQIYSYKKDFPPLAVGDYISVRGEISQARGVKRVKTKTKDDIDILKIGPAPEPLAMALSEISEENLGGLIKISGEITEIKTGYMYLDDGDGELKVRFKTGAKINQKNFKLGDSVEATGVVESASSDFELWPRGPGDVAIIQPAEVMASGTLAVAGDEPRTTAENYLTATAGGLTALLLALFGRARGYLLKNFGKRALVIAVGLFKKRG